MEELGGGQNGLGTALTSMDRSIDLCGVWFTAPPGWPASLYGHWRRKAGIYLTYIDRHVQVKGQ